MEATFINNFNYQSYSNTECVVLVDNLYPVEQYIAARKAERGLTRRGEEWIRYTLPKFATAIANVDINIVDVSRDNVRAFLAEVNGVYNRHSHFRAIRAFYNWLEREGRISISPCAGMQAPKLPVKVLPRPTLREVHELLEITPSARDRAIISMLMDTGFRLNEIAGIRPEDLTLRERTVKVRGKGNKERMGRYGETTDKHLNEHFATYSPNGNIWGITYEGIRVMLQRLKKKTGIVCNAHSFRRAWAIESIKKGVNLLDIQLLGGWVDFEMVKTYAREVTSDDAIRRYKSPLD